jgi:hypothetical protein
MRNRADAVQGFNKPREQVLLHGQSRRSPRPPVIKRPGPKAASKASVLLGPPRLDIVPGCIQPGQPVFNEAPINSEFCLRSEESEGGPSTKTCHEGRCQTAPEVQGRLSLRGSALARKGRIQGRNRQHDSRVGRSRSGLSRILPSKPWEHSRQTGFSAHCSGPQIR